MKVTETERSYAFEVTVSQFKKIVKRDDLSMYDYKKKRLITLICAIPHVREVNFDQMFGAVIFCRIEIEGVDIPTVLGTIKRTISRYAR